MNKYSSQNWLLLLVLTIIFVLNSKFVFALSININSVINDLRLQLTQDYSKTFYNQNSYLLIKPKMIVIQITKSTSLTNAIETYAPAQINPKKEKYAYYSNLNIGTHYLIDKEGQINELIPSTIKARSTIGYNHTAISISNEAYENQGLNFKQAKSTVDLINYLKTKHPSIEFVIGHHEYNHKRMPHFKLYHNPNETIKPIIQINPGWSFMKKIRLMMDPNYKELNFD
ncbi:hypothetical protein DID75_02955 [Candidatus Marinamargulisbacteria bacterium SCGC AG-410-N11]|nr:hypothetical protein DID75_02955 [Candidatus Marinamargulisbacteria bacterium SCGC AG-410-N11]